MSDVRRMVRSGLAYRIQRALASFHMAGEHVQQNHAGGRGRGRLDVREPVGEVSFMRRAGVGDSTEDENPSRGAFNTVEASPSKMSDIELSVYGSKFARSNKDVVFDRENKGLIDEAVTNHFLVRVAESELSDILVSHDNPTDTGGEFFRMMKEDVPVAVIPPRREGGNPEYHYAVRGPDGKEAPFNVAIAMDSNNQIRTVWPSRKDTPDEYWNRRESRKAVERYKRKLGLPIRTQIVRAKDYGKLLNDERRRRGLI